MTVFQHPWTISLLVVAACLASPSAAAAQDPDFAPPPVPKMKPTGFFLWTDTSLSLLAGGGYEVEPDKQTTLTLEHAHSSTIGDFYGYLDLTDFHDVDDGTGMTWYGELGARFSAGKIFNRDLTVSVFPRSFFEFKDFQLAFQYERGEDADAQHAVLLGVGLDLDVNQSGMLGQFGKFKYIQMNFYARSNLAEGRDHGFEDLQVTLTAGKTFSIGDARFLVDGYLDWIVGLGSEESSFRINPQIKLDLGSFWDNPEKIYVGVELDFWWDKYQIEDSSDFTTDQQAASLMIKAHF